MLTFRQKSFGYLSLRSRAMSMASSSHRDSSKQLNLDEVREELIRQEDSIVFALIERAKHPRNEPAYDPAFLAAGYADGRSLAEVFVHDAEAVHAKAGLYQKPEEVPFFVEDLPPPLIPAQGYSQVLHKPAASVSVNKAIWEMYFKELLPLFTVEGDDGNYAATVASDLVCLQVLSRRIHYGKYVAEVKFRDAPQDYTPPIRAKDSGALMNLLTFKAVEEKVKRRVAKKARMFGQRVTLEDKCTNMEGTDGECACKVDPQVVYHLYDLWVMPLTKDVEVEYLLRRLN